MSLRPIDKQSRLRIIDQELDCINSQINKRRIKENSNQYSENQYPEVGFALKDSDKTFGNNAFTQTKSICIASTIPLMMSGLNQVFTNHPMYRVCNQYSSLLCLEEEMNQLQTPDLLIIDSSFIDSRSKKRNQFFWSKWRTIKILLIHSEKKPLKIRQFLKSGINGYISHNSTTEEIISATEHIVNGELYISQDIQKYLWQVDPLKQNKKALTETSLTKRELQVLQLIVDEYSTKEIADKLFIAFCTVETHRKNIIQKLGVKNTAGIVREAVCQQLYNGSATP